MPFLRLPARGWTLPQLLVVSVLVAAIATAALPSFSLTLARSRSAASVNLLLGSLHFARSAALLQALPTAVCLTADGAQCLEQPDRQARGWLVFHDLTRGRTVQVDGEDTLLRAVELPSRMSAFGSRGAVTYWPVARAGTTATFLICPAGQPREARAVVVSQSGRARAAAGGEWTDRLRCP
jgi:type IV fimbrial biogenesis protein FimT